MTSTTNKDRKGVRRVLPVLAIALVLYLIGLGVVLIQSRSDDSTSAPEPIAFGHIHGLGVDPQSGELYAGTHYGAFRIGENAEPQAIGPVRDYMGFTINKAGDFLASGHPGVGENELNPLGLIKSTDKGKTWTTQSLSGRADFHALEASGNRIYGYNNGAIMQSDDGKQWNTRAAFPLLDLAVHPDNVNTIAAIASSGLTLSTDGAVTFSPLPGAPSLSLITWPTENTLYGVTKSGDIFVSSDAGKTWDQRGNAGGTPQAITVTNTDVYVATATDIMKSIDGGKAFASVARTTE